MQPKHSAIVAGLTLALSFGAVSAPAPAAAEEPTPGVASDATDIDKGLYTQQSFSGVLRSVQGVSFVNVTPEMKYFTKYESHGNYTRAFRMVTATTRWAITSSTAVGRSFRL